MLLILDMKKLNLPYYHDSLILEVLFLYKKKERSMAVQELYIVNKKNVAPIYDTMIYNQKLDPPCII
jgi:hypothetical protein